MTATALRLYSSLSYDQLKVRARDCFKRAAVEDDKGNYTRAQELVSQGEEFNRLAGRVRQEMVA